MLRSRPALDALPAAFDHVIATFSPPEGVTPVTMRAAIGKRGRFRRIRIHTRWLGPGLDRDQMVPLERWVEFPFLSCPLEHLKDIEVIEG